MTSCDVPLKLAKEDSLVKVFSGSGNGRGVWRGVCGGGSGVECVCENARRRLSDLICWSDRCVHVCWLDGSSECGEAPTPRSRNSGTVPYVRALVYLVRPLGQADSCQNVRALARLLPNAHLTGRITLVHGRPPTSTHSTHTLHHTNNPTLILPSTTLFLRHTLNPQPLNQHLQSGPN